MSRVKMTPSAVLVICVRIFEKKRKYCKTKIIVKLSRLKLAFFQKIIIFGYLDLKKI